MPAKSEYYDEPDDQHSALTEKGGEEDAGASAVGLLPKAILMGKKFNVGDEVVLKITAIHDDQIEVEYATGEEEKPEEGTPAEEAGETPAEEAAEPAAAPVESANPGYD